MRVMNIFISLCWATKTMGSQVHRVTLLHHMPVPLLGEKVEWGAGGERVGRRGEEAGNKREKK